MAIKKEVIASIGYFDEKAFPQGYGEENDYCLRAEDAGFELAVADQSYVYHAKSKSYSHARRRELAKRGGRALGKKHGRARVKASVERLRNEPVLADLRRRLGYYIEDASRETHAEASPEFSVLFILPVRGGGGGAHSVVQEADGMRRLGLQAQIAVPLQYRTDFQKNYPSLTAQDELFFFYHDRKELIERAAEFNIVIGTVFHSMQLVREVVASNPQVMPAYYVQDYEPRFFRKFSPNWKRARDSYCLVPGTVLFAKTDWIRETVERNHRVKVEKVSPSLDQEIYYSGLGEHKQNGPVRITAMIRPSTPRRGAKRTLRVLSRIKSEFGDGVEVHLFGCGDEELKYHRLRCDFPLRNHGILLREEVADLLRQSDVFSDFSDYQAFGRTGLEAMACGCAVVLPAEGGVGEFAIDGVNARLVDTRSEKRCHAVLKDLVADHEARRAIQIEATRRATEFSVRRAAVTEIAVLGKRRRNRQDRAGIRPPNFLNGRFKKPAHAVRL